MDQRPCPAQFGSPLFDRLSFWRGGKLVHQSLFIAEGFLLQVRALLIKDGLIEINDILIVLLRFVVGGFDVANMLLLLSCLEPLLRARWGTSTCSAEVCVRRLR